MKDISSNTIENLEFDKLLAMLSSCCVTSMGRERCRNHEVYEDPETVRGEHRLLSELLELKRMKKSLKVRRVPDITDIFEQLGIEDSTLELESFLDIRKVAEGSEQIKDFVLNNADEAENLFDEFCDLSDLQNLIDEIDSTISDKKKVKDSASARLKSIRDNIRTLRDTIGNKLEEMINSPQFESVLSEQIFTVRNDRYVIPLKKGRRKSVDGIVQGRSSSGATLFVEPKRVVEDNNRLIQLGEDEREEVKRILSELTEKMRERRGDLEKAFRKIIRADILNGRLKLAVEMEAVNPAMERDQPFYLKSARHPLLDERLSSRRAGADISTGEEEDDEVVPIDLDLSDGISGLVITGPNTGGKTAVLKLVGLMTLMAHSGMFLPADEAKVPFLEGVYADIGDQQSLINSLSTFSGHIKSIVDIIQQLREPALVLLDEIGSGTDPEEGAALAQAIIDYFLDKDTVMLVTTHKSQLKAYADKLDRLDNARVEFDYETLQPTYNLRRGLPGRSNAIHIAGNEDLPEEIIQNAKSRLDTGTVKMNRAIDRLESERKSLKEEKDLVLEQKEQLRETRSELENEKDRLNNEREQLLEEYYGELKEKLANLKKRTQKLEREKGKDTSDSGDKAEELAEEYRDTLSDVRNELKKERSDGEIPDLKQGDPVKVRGLGVRGNLAELKGDKAKVTAKGKTLEVSAQRLEKTEKKKTQSGNIKYDVKSRQKSNSIDLRGERVKEALKRTEKFIDSAVVSNSHSLIVLHGKGSGKLRDALRSYLSEHSAVESYRKGEPEEGGNGVTVVKLG